MSKIADRVLDEYAERLRRELPVSVRKLIDRANTDLYDGPLASGGDYPGFAIACNRITQCLDNIDIGEVWIDIQSEEVLTSEPTNSEDDDEIYYVDWEDIVHFDRRAVLTAMVGRELASYL